MRITKQVRVGLKGYEFAKEYSREYHIPISKVMDLAIKYFNGEHKKEKEELEAQFSAMFPNRRNQVMGQKRSKPPTLIKLSTLRKDMRTGDFWTSPKYSADNDYEIKP
ncbi:MAG: hypothetical protein WAZ10_03545 [Minisyncoccia bacterium]